MQRYYNVLFESKLNESRNITMRYAEAINEETERLSLKVSALAFNRQFLKLVNEYSRSESMNRSFQIDREIENILDIYFDYSDEVISVFLFLENRPMYIYKNPALNDETEILSDDWYGKVIDNPNRVLLLDDLSYQRVSGTPSYRLAAAIRPQKDALSQIKAILVLFQSKSLENLLRTGNNKNRYSLNSSVGDVIFTDGFPDGIDKRIESGRDFLQYEVLIEKPGWALRNYMDIQEIRTPVFNSVLIFLILMSFITILFLIYSLSLMRQVIGPINESIKRMPMVERGDFSVRMDSSKIPELDKMARSFNNMVKEIQILTDEIRDKEQEKKAIEIQALQFQINPHFLSNTLNSIKIMARMIDAESIRETTTSLMRIVSNSFREPGELNSLSKEIDSLNDYIHIMKVRFGDTFRVRIYKENNVDELKIMKMLIQPIVENAVIHGLSSETGNGCLFIGFKIRNNKLLIQIIDNGKGMEVLPERENGSFGHKGLYNIGINNVKERIRMNYGKEYGLNIEGRSGLYTKVILQLPLIGGLL